MTAQTDDYPETTDTAEGSAEPAAQAPPAPQPKKRKLLRSVLIALIAILLLAGAFYTYFMFFSQPTVTKPFAAAPATEIADYEVTPAIDQIPSQIEPSAVDSMEMVPVGGTEVHDPFAEQTSANALLLEDIEKSLQELQLQNEKLGEHISALLGLRASVVSLINMQSVIAESTEDRLQAIEDSIHALSQAQPTPSSEEPDQSKPPFRLIGIDRWNNEWNAVILLDSKMTTLETDETRADWTLYEIDAAKRQAHFVHASGEAAILTVE